MLLMRSLSVHVIMPIFQVNDFLLFIRKSQIWSADGQVINIIVLTLQLNAIMAN